MRRLRQLSDGALEAGWIATVILIPLFINKTGAHVFEPPKAGLLQGLAIFMLLAWIIRALSSTPGTATRAAEAASRAARVVAMLRAPLFVPVALVLITMLLATLLSIAPQQSLWGHEARAQGALTLLAQLSIFAATCAGLSTPRQVRRLVTALLLPSLPIATYAVFQRLGLEPLQVTLRDTDVERVTSLLGQPVWLGAYLAMVAPFSAARALEALGAREAAPFPRWLAASWYVLLLALQVTAALLSESRGPLLALACGAGLGTLALAARRASRGLVLLLVACAGGVALLFALAIPERLLDTSASAEQTRMARRAAETFAVSGGGGQFRVTSWQVAERVLKNTEPLELADGTRDAPAALRRVLGYGPEMQYAISPPFYDAELPRLFGYFLIDRYHNDLWDIVITSGVSGLVAWLILQSALLWRIMVGLGLVATALRTRWFWLSYAGAALAGALGSSLLHGLPFVFLGLQAGAVLGVALFLSAAALLSGGKRASPAGAQPTGVAYEAVLCAALATVTGHLVEASFSFTIIATGALFWITCALVVVCTRRQSEGEPAWSEAPATKSVRAPGSADEETLRDPLADGALLGLGMVALGFAFLGGHGAPGRAGDVVWEGLTALSQPPGAHSPVVAIVAGSTLLLGALMFSLEASHTASRTRFLWYFRWTLGSAAVVALGYWLRLGFILARLGATIPSRTLVVSGNLEIRTASTLSMYLTCLLLMLVFAAVTAIPSRGRALAWWRGALVIAFSVLGLGLIDVCSLQTAGAEAAVALGDGFRSQAQLDLAEEAYQRARALRPRLDAYDKLLAKTHVAHARADAAHADAWLERAERALIAASTQNPIAGEHVVNLALTRSQRAQRNSGEKRAALSANVSALYARALRLNPQDPTAWRGWASTQANLLQDTAGALTSARRALSLDPRSAAAHALVGDVLSRLARTQSGELQRRTYLEAAGAYERARDLSPGQEAAFTRARSRSIGLAMQALSTSPNKIAPQTLTSESTRGDAPPR